MERFFKTEQGQIVDVVDHCIEQIAKYNNLRIYIATDSQNSKKASNYATVVVFRYGTNGAHYVYKYESVKKIKDLFVRLFREAELSIEAAEMITKEIPIQIEAIEFDFNNVKKTESTKVIAASKGWAESLGYKVRLKADEMIATKAADHICRKKY